MTTTPPASPTFLCTACSQAICDDCASTAAEYEFLAVQRSAHLARAEDDNKALKRQIADLQRSVDLWQYAAKAGYPDVIKTWMDAEIERAGKAGRRHARREMKKSGLLALIDEMEKVAHGNA
jgi:phage protein D